MPTWLVVLIVIFVVGVAVIAYGFFHDRAVNQRRREEMLNPPDRIIPGFAARESGPAYLSARQAHTPPAEPTPLTSEERAAAQAVRADVEPLRIGYAAKDFVNDTDGGLVVLTNPIVLVCAEPVQATRELLPVVDVARRRQSPLVIVAPEMDATVLETMAVNRIQLLLRVVVVLTPDMDLLFTIAQRTGASLVDRSDLQAGYHSDEHLGRCAVWVSSADRTWLRLPSTRRPGRAEVADRDG